MYYYEILLLRSSAPSLTYSSQHILTIGSIISVPLKTTLKDAVVLEEVEKPKFETAEVVSLSEYTYSNEQMEIAKFISEYYFSSLGEAISLFMPFKNTSSTTLLPKTIDEKVLPKLSSSQQKAYDQLLKKDKALLFGVTGSGKTEIFISLMAKMMEEGKTSIFLMPEISLTPQMEKRLKVYFGESVAMWHSKLTKKKKESILEGIEAGEDPYRCRGTFCTFCTVIQSWAHHCR